MLEMNTATLALKNTAWIEGNGIRGDFGNVNIADLIAE